VFRNFLGQRFNSGIDTAKSMGIQPLDTGHFATETHVEEITAAVRHFPAATPG
jgi:hypothetical protein